MRKTLFSFVVFFLLSLSVFALPASIEQLNIEHDQQIVEQQSTKALFDEADGYMVAFVISKPIDYGGLSDTLIDSEINQAKIDTDNTLFNVAVKQNQNFERMAHSGKYNE